MLMLLLLFGYKQSFRNVPNSTFDYTGRVDWPHHNRDKACAVALSAGKNVSRVSSARVISIAVPKIVRVLRKDKTRSPWRSWRGRVTPPRSSGRRSEVVGSRITSKFVLKIDQSRVSGNLDLAPKIIK